MSRHYLTDLSMVAGSEQHYQSDVCIVGAGAAGIYLGTLLAARGLSVALVEAGPSACLDALSAGFGVEFETANYGGAINGRFFGLGGSTSRWGGQLVPHTGHDLKPGHSHEAVWRHIVGRVRAHGAAVLRRLGFNGELDFETAGALALGSAEADLRAAGIAVQMGLMLPFSRKNFAWMLSNRTSHRGELKIFVNSVVKSWHVAAASDGEAAVTSLGAVSPAGKHLRASARRFVIAAGAIESARVLLELDSRPKPVIRDTAAVGCYLADHLSLAIADVVGVDAQLDARLFAPCFSGPWMRGFRFIEVEPPSGSPRAFAHVIFPEGGPGFQLAKELLTRLQQRRRPQLELGKMVMAASDLARLAYSRYAEGRLHIAPGSPAYLQLDMEQSPIRENRVTLGEVADLHGRRIARVRWDISASDSLQIRRTTNRLLSLWPAQGSSVPRLVPQEIPGKGSAKPHDAYHPTGTCRMGDDLEAVVGTDLRVWGTANLWAVNTGVLPSAGTANPTFTMLCLAHELAARLSDLAQFDSDSSRSASSSQDYTTFNQGQTP